ncbi:MAG: tetratricopeptide repeat protein [Candidatus Ozemobacteraceae bacterium]
MADRNDTYAQRFYQAALELFDQGQYGKAIEHIDKAIEKAPTNDDFHYTRGMFYHKMNDLPQAMSSYNDAVRVNPAHANSHFNLGLIMMKRGKVLEAIHEWELVIRGNPADVNATFNIAVALNQVGRRKEAMGFYERVVRLKSDHVQTHQNLGILFRDEGQYEKAKFHLNKLKELDTTYSEIVNAELLKCDEQEFLESALANDPGKLARAVSMTAGYLTGERNSATLLALLTGDFPEALRMADTVLRDVPGDVDARLVRGQALLGMERSADAIAEFMGVVAEHPACADAHFQLGNLFLAMNEQEKALEHFERVKTIKADYPLISENITNLRMRIALAQGKKP